MSLENYPSYESYKVSGVTWIDSIPVHWKLKRAGFLLDEINVRSTDGTEPLLSLSKTKGVIRRDSMAERGGQAESLVGYKRVAQDDIVVNRMQASNGLISISNIAGITSPDYGIYRTKACEEIRSDIVAKLLQQPEYQGEIKRRVKGVMEGFIRLYSDDLFRLPLICAPLEEQRAIAFFLDDKCEKIDEAVRIKEAQIALLRERRQILIQEAVTRGLNPDAPMKDSGIDWIGQMPAHWEVDKAAHHFAARKGSDAARLTREFCGTIEGPYAVFSGQTDNDGVLGRINRFEFDYSHDGCMLCSTVGAKAMTIRFLKEKFSLSQNCMIITCRTKIGSMEYFSHAFTPVFAYFRNLIPDHMQASFRMEDFYQMKFLLPPKEEQASILSHIANFSKKIDRAIVLKQDQITALKEYKTSLINAAVTGKIKVI